MSKESEKYFARKNREYERKHSDGEVLSFILTGILTILTFLFSGLWKVLIFVMTAVYSFGKIAGGIYFIAVIVEAVLAILFGLQMLNIFPTYGIFDKLFIYPLILLGGLIVLVGIIGVIHHLLQDDDVIRISGSKITFSTEEEKERYLEQKVANLSGMLLSWIARNAIRVDSKSEQKNEVDTDILIAACSLKAIEEAPEEKPLFHKKSIFIRIGEQNWNDAVSANVEYSKSLVTANKDGIELQKANYKQDGKKVLASLLGHIKKEILATEDPEMDKKIILYSATGYTLLTLGEIRGYSEQVLLAIQKSFKISDRDFQAILDAAQDLDGEVMFKVDDYKNLQWSSIFPATGVSY